MNLVSSQIQRTDLLIYKFYNLTTEEIATEETS